MIWFMGYMDFPFTDLLILQTVWDKLIDGTFLREDAINQISHKWIHPSTSEWSTKHRHLGEAINFYGNIHIINLEAYNWRSLKE